MKIPHEHVPGRAKAFRGITIYVLSGLICLGMSMAWEVKTAWAQGFQVRNFSGNARPQDLIPGPRFPSKDYPYVINYQNTPSLPSYTVLPAHPSIGGSPQDAGWTARTFNVQGESFSKLWTERRTTSPAGQ